MVEKWQEDQNLLSDLEKTRGLQIEECRVWYVPSMKVSTSIPILKFQASVSTNPNKSIRIVYSTVKLRLPEDTLIKMSINFFHENIAEMSPKDTALTVWALARMSYPSSPIQGILLKKVEKQLKGCLEDETKFQKQQVRLPP